MNKDSARDFYSRPFIYSGLDGGGGTGLNKDCDASWSQGFRILICVAWSLDLGLAVAIIMYFCIRL